MNVTVETAALAGALKAVRRAANARSRLPVLANVLLAVEDGRLRLSATDLDLALTAWIHAEASADGAVTLPAKTLVDQVASLDADRVAIELTTPTSPGVFRREGRDDYFCTLMPMHVRR